MKVERVRVVNTVAEAETLRDVNIKVQRMNL